MSMLDKTHSIRDGLFEKLKRIELEEQDVFKIAEKSINLITQSMNELRKYISKNDFDSLKSEILFFKEIKPSIFSKLIYFVEIFNIESRRPTGRIPTQKKYLLKELKKIENYFAENLESYQYYRNKMTFLDDKIFVRGKYNLRLYPDPSVYDADPNFSTSHDYKVARIMANDLLSVYLNTELAALDRQTKHRMNYMKESSCHWTVSKIALVELIYALQAGGCINNGTGDIKDIAVLFESVFNIDLGDFYRAFLEIKVRQNPTKLLDNMRIALLKKIEEQDG